MIHPCSFRLVSSGPLMTPHEKVCICCRCCAPPVSTEGGLWSFPHLAQGAMTGDIIFVGRAWQGLTPVSSPFLKMPPPPGLMNVSHLINQEHFCNFSPLLFNLKFFFQLNSIFKSSNLKLKPELPRSWGETT